MKSLVTGQKAQASRTFTTLDIVSYQALSGDTGLAFSPDRSAERTMVPGPLLSGMFSDLLGTQLPGPGTNWLKQTLSYPRPAYVGDEITAVVEITRLRPEKALVNLRTTCVTTTGAVVCEGEALVLVKDLEREG